MFKILIIFTLFLSHLFASTIDLSKEEKLYLNSKSTIKFKIRNNRAPFEFMKDGKPQGIAVDYIKRIGEIVGFKPEFIVLDLTPKEFFAEMEKENPRYDTLAYSVKSPERAERFHFGSSFMSYPVMIISSKESEFISSMKNLKNKTVALEKGFLTKKWIERDYPSIKTIGAQNTFEALKLVNAGSADAYIGNLAIANYLMIYEDLDNLKVAAPTNYKNVTYSFIAPKSQPELASILSKGYKQILPDEHHAIQQKWFSVQFVEKVNYHLIIEIIIILGFIILWILWWNRNLHKRIEAGVAKYKKQQELLIQQSKMAAMGEMIGAIAHQWKQPINNMSLNIEYVHSMHEMGELSKEKFEKRCNLMRDNVEFMNQTINDFRNFFKPNKLKRKFKVKTSVEKVLNILGTQLKSKGIAVNTPTSEVEVESIANELEQVILNVVNNAKDVLMEKHIQDPTIEITLHENKTQAILEITDNGGGIESEDLTQVFNSYFSTKGENGTGVGLYMSKLIVENSLGGEIKAENIEKGAKFSIIIPKSKDL